MSKQTLARLPAPGRSSLATARLSRAQKAAIIVRFLLNEGAEVPLKDLPDDLQRKLTQQMGTMRYVDRTTLGEVVAEFASEVEAMGLTFPNGVAGALSALDGRISQQTAHRLRKEAGVRQFGEPWEQVKAAEREALLKMLSSESIEVAAVLLSKLEVARAAELLSRLPGATARRIAYAMSQTSAVTPEAVDRIGLSLAAQLHDVPDTAFNQGPEQRVGAILNYSTAGTRDDVMAGLEETDEDFANKVRKAIFTFHNIADRVQALDVPKVMRDMDQERVIMALSHAMTDEAGAAVTEFLLKNMSKRLAETIREEMAESGKVKKKDGEAAQTEMVNLIRELEARGEIVLIVEEDDEDE